MTSRQGVLADFTRGGMSPVVRTVFWTLAGLAMLAVGVAISIGCAFVVLGALEAFR